MQNKLILASGSPRRKELLESLGLDFQIIVPDILEPELSDFRDAIVIAQMKAKALLDEPQKLLDSIFSMSPSDSLGAIDGDLRLSVGVESRLVILAADTVVAFGEKVLGKPKDKQDAFNMLKSLSGRKHLVATGLSIISIEFARLKELAESNSSPVDSKDYESFSSIEKTEIVFRSLSDDEINSYIESKEPMDKAGSYAIQGKGGAFVEGIFGCYTNVVGLPLPLVLDQLSQLGFQFQASLREMSP